MLLQNEVLHLWERWRASLSHKCNTFSSAIIRRLCRRHRYVINTSHSASLTHVASKRSITFVGTMACKPLSQMEYFFVADHPTTLSASSVCQVVYESARIIQLYSRMLDKKTKYYICGSDGVQPLSQILHLWEVNLWLYQGYTLFSYFCS